MIKTDLEINTEMYNLDQALKYQFIDLETYEFLVQKLN